MNNSWMNTTLDDKRLEKEYYRFHTLANKSLSYGQCELYRKYKASALQVQEALHNRGYKNF